MSARAINGILYVDQYWSTGNPGQYGITGAIYTDQADTSGQGATEVETGYIIYVPALDSITQTPIPGIVHRYVITSIQNKTYKTLDATIDFNESGSQKDQPQGSAYALISEPTPNYKYGLLPSRDVYANIAGGLVESAYNCDTEYITDNLGLTGGIGPTGAAGYGVTGLPGIPGVTGPQAIFFHTDGGSAATVYLPTQHIDGGGA